MKSEKALIAIGFCVISLVWGSTWLAIKIGLEVLPPLLSAGIRFTVASAILYGIIRFRGLRVPFHRDARITYAALGFLSFSIPFALVYWGEQYIPSALPSILFGAFPLWVGLFMHFSSTTERLDRWKLAGALLGLAGIIVIYAPGVVWGGVDGMLGMTAVLLATLLQAYGLIPTKRHGQAINPIVMNFVGMTIGAIFLLILGAVLERNAPMTWNAAAWGSIAYLAVFGSVVAFVTYYWLLKRVQAIYLSMTSFISPIVAVLLGALILHEELPAGVLSGGALVLAGIAVANGKGLLGIFRRRNPA